MNTLKVELIVPKWVNWMAVDENGQCWMYESKPIANVDVWFIPFNVERKRKFKKLYEGKPPKNWKEELYTWS